MSNQGDGWDVAMENADCIAGLIEENTHLRAALELIAKRQHQFPHVVAQAALDGRGAWSPEGKSDV